MNTLAIIADHLVEKGAVATRLRERGATVTAANLLAGHYRISEKCAIVHVDAAQFSQWITKKEIYRRVADLKRTIPEPVFVIEGKLTANESGLSPNGLRGALAFLAVHNRVPVLFSGSAKEAADLIFAMANQIQNGMGERPGVVEQTQTPEPCAADENNGNGNGNGNGQGELDSLKPCERIVRMVPEVGPTTARAMMTKFGSLRGIFSASARDLTKVEGLGPKKAKKIAAFFDTKCK